MNTQHFRYFNLSSIFISIFSFLFLSHCVSVKLNNTEVSPAKDIRFESPNSQIFSEIKVLSSDKAWISKSTGNTISYYSDCQKNSDPSLELMQSDAISVLENPKILQENQIEFNMRKAQESISEGSVDGVLIKMKILVFKKNGCNIIISYGGVKKNFNLELSEFQNFLTHFKI